MGKEIWQPIYPRNFGFDVSIRPPVCPYRLWGRGKGVPRQLNGGRIIAFFSWCEIAQWFGATNVFLGVKAHNHHHF